MDGDPHTGRDGACFLWFMAFPWQHGIKLIPTRDSSLAFSKPIFKSQAQIWHLCLATLTVVCPAPLSSGTVAGTCISDVKHFTSPYRRQRRNDSYIPGCQRKPRRLQEAEPSWIESGIKNGEAPHLLRIICICTRGKGVCLGIKTNLSLPGLCSVCLYYFPIICTVFTVPSTGYLHNYSVLRP